MSALLPIQGVPLAVPFASSHDCRLPLWDKAFGRITPGALSVCCAVLFPSGGRA
jgi:hypothetical protein